MKRALSDARLSLGAKEFVWERDGLTEAHAYILPALQSRLSRRGIRKVLDIGCGNGALTHRLSASGLAVLGVDNSESGIALCQTNYPDTTFRKFDIGSSFPQEFHHRFEAVVAIEVIEHLPFPRVLFQRAKEALLPGGVLLLSTPYHGYLKNLALAVANCFDEHWHPLRDFGHVKFFSPRTLAQLFLEQGFRTLDVTRLGRIPPLAKSMLVEGVYAE